MEKLKLEKLRQAASSAFPGRGVVAAYAYGSRVGGSPRPDSDLDVGYHLVRGREIPLAEELFLEGVLSGAVGLSFDLRNLGGAPLELKGMVLEEGVRIYSGDDAARVDLEVSILARYHDYKDVYRRMHEERLAHMAGGT